MDRVRYLITMTSPKEAHDEAMELMLGYLSGRIGEHTLNSGVEEIIERHGVSMPTQEQLDMMEILIAIARQCPEVQELLDRFYAGDMTFACILRRVLIHMLENHVCEED
jgi:ribosomal protein S12 methylthiotransferase accessory factor YcaO